MIVNKIYEFISANGKTVDEALRYEVEKIAGFAFRRQFMEAENEVKPWTIRLSSCGRCVRQQAYKYWGTIPKGKVIDARGKITFFQGDLVELMIVQLAKASGLKITATGLQQMSVAVTIAGQEILGHPDGVLFDDEICLIEVKSMSDYGFKKFEKGEIDDAYIAQVNMYMSALKLTKCCFIGLNKNNGILHEIIVERDDKLVEQIKKNLELVINSTSLELPEPPEEYNPVKGLYPWQCLYCSYHCHCRPNAEKVLVGRAYKLKEKGANND